MEQRLCEAAIEGNLQLLDKIIAADKLILGKVVAGCINANPLHVAATLGHTQFVQELLLLKPELAEVLDSRYRSALHLATTKGHVEIVQALVRKRPEMCLARDRDGRNPLHIAAMEGKVDILKELVEAKPHAAREKVDSGETILHLCVKHNQLGTLSLLMEEITNRQFVNTKNNDGNTILHTAVSAKQFEIAEDLLTNHKHRVDLNATNSNGNTALDILLQNETDMDLSNIKGTFRKVGAKTGQNLVQGEWLAKKREALIIVASLIATMAFQAGVNPPGGVWQDNLFKNDTQAGVNNPPACVWQVDSIKNNTIHRAGEAVMAYNYPDSFPYFLRANTIGLVASLTTILLLISGLPFRKRSFMWFLVVIMWLTITSMAFTYAFSITVITPNKDRSRKALQHTIVVAVIVWCSVMAFLLLVNTIRLISNMLQQQPISYMEGFKRIFKTILGLIPPRTHPNSTNGIQA